MSCESVIMIMELGPPTIYSQEQHQCSVYGERSQLHYIRTFKNLLKMQHNSPSKKECTFRNDIYQLYPATSTHHSVPTATIYSSLVQQYAVPPKLSVWLGFKVKATKCMYPVRNCPQSARRRYLQFRVGNKGIFEATLFANIGLSKCINVNVFEVKLIGSYIS